MAVALNRLTALLVPMHHSQVVYPGILTGADIQGRTPHLDLVWRQSLWHRFGSNFVVFGVHFVSLRRRCLVPERDRICRCVR